MRTQLTPEEQIRLLLALPSHVTVLFSAILLTLWITLWSGMGGPLRLYALTMFGLSIILPIRDLLTWVDSQRKYHRSQVVLELQTFVDQIAKEIGLQRPPRIELSTIEVGIHAVGGLRRHIIIGGSTALVHLKQQLISPNPKIVQLGRAILAHEMQHFLRKDTRYLEFTRCLLVSLLNWAIWVIFMSVVWFYFLAFFLPSLHQILNRLIDPNAVAQDYHVFFMFFKNTNTLLNDTLGFTYAGLTMAANDYVSIFTNSFTIMTAPMRASLPSVERFNLNLSIFGTLISLFPIIIGTRFLWSYTFYRMLHMREHYADLGAAAHATIEATVQAILDTEPSVEIQPNTFKPAYAFWSHKRTHPSSRERRYTLRHPIESLTDPITNGRVIGTVLAFLSIVLNSGFAYATIDLWIYHLGALTGLMALIFVMTPSIFIYSPIEAWDRFKQALWQMIMIGFSINIGAILLGFILYLFSPITVINLLKVVSQSLSIDINHSYTTPDLFAQRLLHLLISLVLTIGALFLGARLDLQLKQTYLPKFLATPLQLKRSTWIISLTITSGILALLSLTTTFITQNRSFLAPVWLLIITTITAGLGGLWLLIKHKKT